eukprot:SAG31_NODE_2696_length_5228_cov_2.063365_6_plen_80_part_00
MNHRMRTVKLIAQWALIDGGWWSHRQACPLHQVTGSDVAVHYALDRFPGHWLGAVFLVETAGKFVDQTEQSLAIRAATR